MALVITLIMLSVTLIMAIAFLAVARRERISVSTSTDTTVARFAADTALAQAESQIIANIYATTNATLYSYNLLVSTNYISGFGFDRLSPFLTNPTNVSYNYPNGNVLGGADFAQNVANLLFLPRAPVLVSSNEPAGRFYIDLNRNGVFDDTGTFFYTVDEFGVTNQIFSPNPPFTVTGDPQWVGILERPGLQHGPDNKFLSRYAFICLPIGDALDINAIHNQAFTKTVDPASAGTDGFMRNQGVGSWEINLAAFLADLNTNQWLPTAPPDNSFYAYYEPGFNNRGVAFDDARALLSWRYNNLYTSLASADQLFGGSPGVAANVLPYDYVDTYSDGPLQFSLTNIDESVNRDKTGLSWSGAVNPNRFFAISDLLDPTKSSVGFTNRLIGGGATTAASGAHPTYDRYTFYRMLDQLGTDSLPDTGKLNLNWANAIVTYDINNAFVSSTIIPGMETNLIAWSPTNFFSAAADQMLKVYTTNWFQTDPTNYLATYYGIINYPWPIEQYTGTGLTNVPFFGMTNQVPAFGLANIPVQVNGRLFYTSAVNRILQLAANIYDAGTNNFYPHVFRPIFLLTNQVTAGVTYENLYIRGYEEIPGNIVLNDVRLTSTTSGPFELSHIYNNFPANSTILGVNIYGIPWIIGAKKNLPSFNELYSFNNIQVSRKLQVSRQARDIPFGYNVNTANDYHTNQMIAMGVTNSIGFSFWNSYASDYPSGAPNYPYANPSLTIYVSDFSYILLSNGLAPIYINNLYQKYIAQNATSWLGSQWDLTQSPNSRTASSASFYYDTTNFTVLPTASLVFDSFGNFNGYDTNGPSFDLPISVIPTFPQITLVATNLFQAYILDNGHVIDYVQFAGPNTSTSVSDILRDPNVQYDSAGRAFMWTTNRSNANSANWGVQNQVYVSQTDSRVPAGGTWTPPPNLPAGLPAQPQQEAGSFKGFFAPSWNLGGVLYTNTALTNQAPYTPVRTVSASTIWVANDPLVHNLARDLSLYSGSTTNGVTVFDDPANPPVAIPAVTSVVDRYEPWGRNAYLNGIPNVVKDDIANNDYHASYDFALKDSLVWGSDNWDFPTNKYPTVGWLGRVHRGTPWQTVYLKATNLLEYALNDATGTFQKYGQNTWGYWTGDFDTFDAGNTKPIQDELLFDVFTAAPNANATLGTLSVNQKNLAAWSAVFGGMVALTNCTPGTLGNNPNVNPLPTNGYVVIDPAGVGTSSPLWHIVNDPVGGINSTRTNLYPNGGFAHVGDILRTPLLTQWSPFINRLDSNVTDDRLDYDISDELYEWLPQQMMGLLRGGGSPSYVIYAWGQTLKPAPDGTMLGGGAFFGLVTNYQVVAESATRAVISVHPVVTNNAYGPVTNYNTKVESFIVLPPQ